jgi:hypothetical protein
MIGTPGRCGTPWYTPRSARSDVTLAEGRATGDQPCEWRAAQTDIIGQLDFEAELRLMGRMREKTRPPV